MKRTLLGFLIGWAAIIPHVVLLHNAHPGDGLGPFMILIVGGPWLGIVGAVIGFLTGRLGRDRMFGVLAVVLFFYIGSLQEYVGDDVVLAVFTSILAVGSVIEYRKGHLGRKGMVGVWAVVLFFCVRILLVYFEVEERVGTAVIAIFAVGYGFLAWKVWPHGRENRGTTNRPTNSLTTPTTLERTKMVKTTFEEH